MNSFVKDEIHFERIIIYWYAISIFALQSGEFLPITITHNKITKE